MKAVVIIPNWNGIDYLGPCLKSLKEQTVPTDVILVDNGSTDGSVGLVKSYYPEVKLIELEENRGFAGGVNAGIKVALEGEYEYIALLNNDAVAAINWMEELLAAIQAVPEAGIITSKILSIDKTTLDSTGDFYSIWGTPFPRGRGEVDNRQYDEPLNREVFAASGGASIYRAELFRQIGLFDERFFAYYEDVDISFRAQLAGWRVLYEPNAHAYHHIGGTSKKLGSFSQYHMLKNTWYLYVKNMPKGLFGKHFLKVVFAIKMKSFALLVRFRFGVVFKAGGNILRNLPGILRDRKRIQQNRVASVERIDSLLYHDLSPTQKEKRIYRLFNKNG